MLHQPSNEVGVLTIGIIGFLLDRVMYALQSMFTFSNNR